MITMNEDQKAFRQELLEEYAYIQKNGTLEQRRRNWPQFVMHKRADEDWKAAANKLGLNTIIHFPWRHV